MAVKLKSNTRKKTMMKLPMGFLEYFLPRVNGDYLRIYMYGLKAGLEKKPVTDVDIANALGVLPNDVSNAWNFWENEGVISTDNGIVEFIMPDELDFQAPKEKKESKKKEKFDTVVSKMESDQEFLNKIQVIEAIYPRLLTQNDAMTLYDIVMEQGISVDLFLVTAAQCMKRGKNHFNYITKVLTETFKKGYTTPEAMEAFYASQEESMKVYGKIKKILKIYNRDLVDKEKEFIDKWLELGKTDEEIKEAFEKTVMNTGKLSFQYMDKIVCGKKGNKQEKSPSVKAGPLNNFSQQMPDFKEIEDIILEKQRNF